MRTKYKREPGSYKVVIAPDYRHDDVQIRMDKASAEKLEGKAMQYLETRFPTAPDIAAAMVGHETSALFAGCAPTTKAGSCKNWTAAAGRLLFLRRGWQSVRHHRKPKAGSNINHHHLRIGDVFIDGTFLQFDNSVADSDANGELFVGTRGELIQRLGNLIKPEIPGADGQRMFDELWDVPPLEVNGQIPRLVHKPSGEADWDP